MARKRYTIPLVCFFSFVVACLFAQTEQFKFKRLELKDGLSHPDIWSIFKDSRGFVWFGTPSGLNRFDGYTIKSFLNAPDDTTSISQNGVSGIFETPDGLLVIQLSTGRLTLYNPLTEKFERQLQPFYKKYGASPGLRNIVRDSDGSYWFIEPEKLIRYNPQEKRNIIVENNNADPSLANSVISNFCIDRKGNHWLGHSNGIIEKVEISNGRTKVVQRISVLRDRYNSDNISYQMLPDTDGDLWFCAPSANLGVFRYHVNEKKLEQISTRSAPLKLNTNSVTDILEDNNGLIWVATDHGGINIIDKKKARVQYLVHRDGDQMSLVANSITHLYKDDQGIIWTGAYRRGISYYHPNIYKFEVYKHYSIDPRSLPFEDINTFEEDRKGNLWIGTNGGGLLYFDRESGKFTQYVNEPGNINSLSGNVVVSLCRDSEDNLWVGTFTQGLNKFDGKKFTRFVHVQGDTSSLPSQNVWEIFEDSKKRLWIGTVDAGAGLFDKKSGKFHRFKARGQYLIEWGSIEEINEDRYGRIWFGTPYGIDVLSPDSPTLVHYGASSEPHSLGNDIVQDIMKDSKGRLWIGTGDGLFLFDESINGFRTFRGNDTQRSVLAIEEDGFGNMWMSTLNGLSKMTFINGSLDSVSYKHYTESDGLQGRQFNVNASFKTHKGDLVFGGPTGFNISNGTAYKEDFVISKIVFSELELYEKPVEIGEKVDGIVHGAVLLNETNNQAVSIKDLREITQFEIDSPFQNYNPHNHYTVEPTMHITERYVSARN